MRQVAAKTRHGDTLIEVMMAIAIFAIIAMLGINMMNNGINMAQRTLETEMARNEIDAQAEAIRFIHNSYVSERQQGKEDTEFHKVWNNIVSRAVKPSETREKDTDKDHEGGNSFDINDMSSCSVAYEKDMHLSTFHSFIVNPRLIVPDIIGTNSNFQYLGMKYSGGSSSSDSLMRHMIVYAGDENPDSVGRFIASPLYPRIIFKSTTSKTSKATNETSNLDEYGQLFTTISTAEGIWVDVVGNNEINPVNSDYFDFYIRTCWQSVGTRALSTITTIVRLYNPEVMK